MQELASPIGSEDYVSDVRRTEHRESVLRKLQLRGRFDAPDTGDVAARKSRQPSRLGKSLVDGGDLSPSSEKVTLLAPSICSCRTPLRYAERIIRLGLYAIVRI